MSKPGKVYIAGAGPGDVGLITLKCFEILKKADVIIYDFLVNRDLLLYARKDAEKIYVGKSGSKHEMEQDMINELMVEKAKKYSTILRLKGGDPFIFGRGGEEAEYLKEKGVPFEVIPGVTSAISAPAYAGIPLTHRDFSSSVIFVTGHETEQKKGHPIDWQSLASFKGTIVFLMGMKNIDVITKNLLNQGMNPDTDVCVIHWGTTPMQRVVTSKLGKLEEDVKSAGLKAPAVIVIGAVAKLRERLLWYERLPPFGKRIMVTRALEQSFEIADMLRAEGAEVLIVPTIKIVEIWPNEELVQAIKNMSSYFGVIFTSVNGVKYFFQRLFDLGKDSRDLFNVKIFAIGNSSSAAISSYGIRPDFVPDEYISEGIIEILRRFDLKGKRFLLPRALEARDAIREHIEKSGGICDVVPTYKTEIPDVKVEIKEIPDVVTFTSPSTVKNFAEMYGVEVLRKVTLASIGPVTTRALRDLNLEVHIEAKRHDIKGLVEAIKDFYQGT